MEGYGAVMNRVYTALTKQDNGWWIGWIEEVPGANLPSCPQEAIEAYVSASRGNVIRASSHGIQST
jgi:hypothetical protein